MDIVSFVDLVAQYHSIEKQVDAAMIAERQPGVFSPHRAPQKDRTLRVLSIGPSTRL
jgi:hypothetical protein